MLVPITPQPGIPSPRPRRFATAVRPRGRGHLLVVADDAGYVVASCRLHAVSARGGVRRMDAEAHFDLSALDRLRDRLVEVVHARMVPGAGGPARDALWDALARFLLERRLDHVLGTVAFRLPDASGLHAAGLWRRLETVDTSPEGCRAIPRRALPFCGAPAAADRSEPWLEEWTARGAWLCGDPARAPGVEVALVPFLLPLARMRAPAARAFLAGAA